VGNGAVVNTQTLNQMFLINLPELESQTISASVHSSNRQKIGDIGEIEFDLECARLNLAPFRPALSNGSIDRLILLPSGDIKKIHIKTATLTNKAAWINKRKNTGYENYYYSFATLNSLTEADYYFCCAIDQNYKKSAIWWIPWSIRTSMNIPQDGSGFEPYRLNPFEEVILNKGQLCP
jgi:hypothetical protein